MTSYLDLQTGYQAYDTDEDAPDQHLLTDEEAPVHVHSNGHSDTARWNHIENLDEFFTRVYNYHQKHGFVCMVLEDLQQLGQFLFIVLFTGFLVDCVNYDILFAVRHPDVKQTLHDVIKTPCSCGFSHPMVSICMFIALSFLAMRCLKVIYSTIKYWEIHQFYKLALRIQPGDIENKTWHEVQTRLMEVQTELQMCIHKNELTQLDIYHRILRFKNYFVAMVNKNVLPLSLSFPFIGQFNYLTHGLKFNLEILLFWGACNISPFENAWHLKNDYKNSHKRIELSQRLSQTILIVGIANLLLSPLIFLWDILYLFFVYGMTVKTDPSMLGSRKWSLYARANLRHFNELDHELNTRLNRGYETSTEYLSGFMSPMLTILAKFIGFIAGAILVVLVCLTIYDEDTLQIEHMLTLMTGCGIILTITKVFIPPENMVFCPETLMARILSHIHYQPDHWKNQAHTSQVRDEFGQLFQLKAIFLLEELLSPLITPLVLIFYLRPKSLEIVDFFRNFTVDVVGVGDVCSFAQLDIGRHGDPDWSPDQTDRNTDSYRKAKHGKTELSLMHFAITNPGWKPPVEGGKFLASVKERVIRDADKLANLGQNALSDSLHALALPNPVAMSMMRSSRMMSRSGFMGRSASLSPQTSHMGPIVRNHSAAAPVAGGLIDALSQSGHSELANDLETLMDSETPEFRSNEISLSVIYLHQLRKHRSGPHSQVEGYENLEPQFHDTQLNLSTDHGQIASSVLSAEFESITEESPLQSSSRSQLT